MAQPATPKCLKGCCLTILIIVLLVVVLIGVSVAVVLNMTPERLGIADMPLDFLGGKTLRDYGLADVKLKEAVKLFKEMMNPDEDKIVLNRFDESVDKPAAQSNAANSSILKEDGSYDFSSVVSEKAVYDKVYLKRYLDTTLAYMFDSMISSAETSVEAEGDPDSTGVKFLRDINANVNEVTISASGDGYTLRIVASISLKPLQDELKNALANAKIPQSLIKIPDRVYIVSYAAISADGEGKLITVPQDIRINDVENAVADAIFAALADSASDAAGDNAGAIETSDKNAINGEILNAFAAVINNLGRIGTASVQNGDEVAAGSERYGNEGLGDHFLTVITYTADDVSQAE